MGRAVEPLPVRRVLEAEVGAHVDDEHLRAELLGHGGGLPVRQREEHHLVPGEDLGGRLLEHPVGQGQQVRLEPAQTLARVGVAGQCTDLDLGVREQQAQHFAARITTRSRHRHAYRHGTLLLDGMTIRFAARLCNLCGEGAARPHTGRMGGSAPVTAVQGMARAAVLSSASPSRLAGATGWRPRLPPPAGRGR